MTPPFTGWSEAAFEFFRELEARNDRTFWLANKAVYEQEVRAPFEALAELVADEFGPLKVARPYRDVRFSRDRSPYKTRCYATSRGAQGETYYVDLSTRGLTAAAGYWTMARDQLARYRQAVDDERAGPALKRLVVDLRRQGLEIEAQPLKTAPRGYTRDHPRIDLLRFKSVAAVRSFEPGPALNTPAVAEEIVAVWRAAGPLTEWLGTHVGPSTD